jgi:hypothetical protein
MTNPKRARVLVLIILGVPLLGAWLLIMTHDPTAKARRVGIAGIATTLVTMGVLLYSYITRRGIANILFALSVIALLLIMVAMVVLTFQA